VEDMYPQCFVEEAPTYYEAERKAKEKYGDQLTILRRETVRIRSGFLKLFSTDGVKIMGIIPRIKNAVQYQETQPEPAAPKAPPNWLEEKEKILAALASANKDGTLKEVLNEVRTIKEKLDTSGQAALREGHPVLNRINEVLVLNDFPVSYRNSLLDRALKELSLDELNNYDKVQDNILEWIGESIKPHAGDKFNVRPRIMILAGPTGVGKTTTIAKLAANFGISDLGRHKRKLVLITIDAYRIGAKEQVETYSELMEFPCFCTAEYDELKKDHCRKLTGDGSYSCGYHRQESQRSG